ncbi:copper amine oxidase N-terminal domain-containing protein [Paenibacillus sp. SC116]|uniref:copper amine oxidase N-terminal domain-containing protein n=1 Tax=Paenibacillus sp. SC116 TaxID=2968986 RepID=UPI00215AB02A|nr:copper amine oxidase N-terminal domain-containing protein [Paenibacillus sp. SC116]MCR8844404.1 copper amine oxidase N-terminal domain-containing protein [Paenibacillus sp. SC116]
MKMKQRMLVLVTAISLTVAAGSLAYADSLVRKVTAYQNGEIKLRVNGDIISTGNTSPLVYNGNTYVPAIYLAKALGASTKWDGDAKEVIITQGSGSTAGDDSAALPTKDNSDDVNTVKPEKNTGGTSNSTFPSYPVSTSATKMYENHKGQAKHLFTLYSKALRTGDLTEIKKFFFDNIKDHNPEYKLNDAESNFNYVKKDIEGLRKAVGKEVAQQFADDLDKKIKSWDLMDSSKGTAYEWGDISLRYSIFMESEDFYEGVHIDFSMKKRDGNWVLTRISM